MVGSDVIYDSLIYPQPPNVPSQPFQAQQTFEFGDQIAFAGAARIATKVTVLMSAFALHSAYPSVGDLTGWTHPITLKLYNVNNAGPVPVPGAVIASVTQSFSIPWRPVGDPTCPNTYGQFGWRAGDGLCYNGFVFPIVFDLTSLNVTLPNAIIYGISYNTQTYGVAPIGADGPYNGLNVAVGTVVPSVGVDVDQDAVFWNTITADWYTDHGAAGVGIFRQDTGWSAYDVNVRFEATTPADLNIVPSVTTVASGSPVNVELRIDGARDLYGYQFTLNFNPDMATAAGTPTYEPSFFTPAGGVDATCLAGVCSFARTLTGAPTGITGSGVLARVSFIANKPGTYILSYSAVSLSDFGESPVSLPVVLHTATIEVVPGSATVNGTIRLQARATPITAGPVTLVQQSAPFATFSTTYDPTTGFFSRAVDAVAAGTTYKLTAAHQNYLDDEKTLTVYPNNTYPQTQASTLRAGNGYKEVIDAIDISDLACVANGFGVLPVQACGGIGGTADINGDTVVNIFDLVLVGGNYGLTAPQPY